MERNTVYKREIEFKDKRNYLIKAKIEIKTNNDNKLVFTMSGEYRNLFGQVFDKMIPANQWQKKLIEYWKKYHLNDLMAGTPKQEEALKECPSRDYKDQCEFLKSRNLYIDTDLDDIRHMLPSHMKDIKEYRYGEAWLTKPLSENFIQDLDVLLDKIKEEEDRKNNRSMKLFELTQQELYDYLIKKGYDEYQAKVIMMFVYELKLTSKDIKNIKVDKSGSYYTVNGVEYLAGSDAVVDEYYVKELDYILDEYLHSIPEHLRCYFDREAWESDARLDGRAHILNHYDGSEIEFYCSIDNEYYYAYRQ